MEPAAEPPLVVYDDRCSLCAAFARLVGAASGGRLPLVGHYTPEGARLRADALGPGALEMFWFVDGRTAYGGRAALAPLLLAILLRRGAGGGRPAAAGCGAAGGGGACSVLARSASLLTRSRRVELGGGARCA